MLPCVSRESPGSPPPSCCPAGQLWGYTCSWTPNSLGWSILAAVLPFPGPLRVPSIALSVRLDSPPPPAAQPPRRASLWTAPSSPCAPPERPGLPSCHELPRGSESLPGSLPPPAVRPQARATCVRAFGAAGSPALPLDGAQDGRPARPHQLAAAGQPAGDSLERGAQETALHAGKCQARPRCPSAARRRTRRGGSRGGRSARERTSSALGSGMGRADRASAGRCRPNITGNTARSSA